MKAMQDLPSPLAENLISTGGYKPPRRPVEFDDAHFFIDYEHEVRVGVQDGTEKIIFRRSPGSHFFPIPE
jgi:hypothetical protein